MSGKDLVRSWLDEMAGDMSVPQILAALQDQLARQGTSPIRDDDYEWPAPDVTEEEWMLFVAQGLRNELEDPREDIYTDENEEPVNGQG